MEISITKRKSLKTFITEQSFLIMPNDVIFTSYCHPDKVFVWNNKREFVGRMDRAEVIDGANFSIVTI